MSSEGAAFRQDQCPTPGPSRENRMRRALQVIGYVVLALMATGVLYANAIAIKYWAGIGV